MTVEETQGITLPALAQMPANLSLLEEEIISLFWLMADSRPVGMGAVSGISTADILACGQEAGFDCLWFLGVIRQLDRVFVQFVNDSQKSRNKNPSKNG